ncbi:hypothetical protein ACFFK0_02000 [Paenibacillus chartarius]|uniref:Uncharacterized protein n=1 Tax=Paenibacillus chartarius TaxID=747481 RepID=A0ABV6DF23_9BACL
MDGANRCGRRAEWILEHEGERRVRMTRFAEYPERALPVIEAIKAAACAMESLLAHRAAN